MRARVFVTLKPSVFDPQGRTIADALRSLGYGGVEDVRQGKYFELDLATTEKFASRVKGNGGEDRVLVSESGIGSAADVARVAAWGVDAVLVGEALVRERDVAAKVRELSACE